MRREGGRLRMHHGPSSGPRTAEGLERLRRLRWEHGQRSREAIERRREMAELVKAASMFGGTCI